MPQHRHAQRFIPGLLFSVEAVGMEHVAVIGAEDEMVFLHPGALQASSQLSHTLIQALSSCA